MWIRDQWFTLLPSEVLDKMPMSERLKACSHVWRAITRDRDVWAIIETGADCLTEGKLELCYQESPPVRQADIEWLQKELEEQLRDRVIVEVEQAEVVQSSRAFVIHNQETDKRRLIVDLRSPNKVCVVPSVKLETLVSVVAALVLPGSWMVTLDIHHAYHGLLLADKWLPLLGFNILGRHFLSRSVCFGWAAAPWCWTSVMRAIVSYLREDCHLTVTAYMDDILLVGKSAEEALAARTTVVELLAALGLKLSKKGQWEPAQSVTYLGLVVSASGEEPTFSVSEKSRKTVTEMAMALLRRIQRDPRRRVPVKILAKLAGKIMSLSLGMRQARLRTRALYDCIALKRSWRSWVVVSLLAVEDLEWLARLSLDAEEEWSRISMARFSKREAVTVWSDASSKAYGGVLGYPRLVEKSSLRALGSVVQVLEGQNVTHGEFVGEDFHRHIGFKELEAIRLVLEAFGPRVDGKRVVLYCDNHAVVRIANSGCSRSKLLAASVRKLWLHCIQRKITLEVEWVPTDLNISDAASRMKVAHDWLLDRGVFQDLQRRWGSFDIDLFASERCHQIRRFVTRHQQKGAYSVDAFTLDWAEFRLCWINPPWSLIPRVLAHLAECADSRSVDAVVVTPMWPSQWWYQRLVAMSVDSVILGWSDECCWRMDQVSGVRTLPEPSRSRRWRLVAHRVHLSGKYQRGVKQVVI